MTTRGERNNNPCNLRASGVHWTGELTPDSAGFCVFDTPEHGIGAAGKNLRAYRLLHGLHTVDQIIRRWSATDQDAYIANVCKALGVGPHDEIDCTDAATLRALVMAIIQQENGEQPYTLAVINAGLDLGGLPADTQPAAPIDDRSEPYLGDNTTTGSKPMPVLALLSAFGPLLQTLIPQIASLFTPKGEVAQRNVKLAETLVSTITTAAGTPTLEGAVQAMQQSDDVKQAVQRAVVTHPDIMSELQIVEVGKGGIGGAREANLAFAPEGKWWAALLTPVMIMSLALCGMLIMVLGNVLGMPWGGSFQSWSENTRSNVVFAVITGAIGAITGYWFGTTVTSNKKDSIIAAQADASRATT